MSVEAFFVAFPPAIDVLFGSLRGINGVRRADILFSESFWLPASNAFVRLGNLVSDKLAGAPSIPAAAWFLVFMLYLAAVAAALMLRRFGQAFGLSAERAGWLLILWAMWNAVLAVDWRRNPFIMPQTAETKAMLRQISGRKVLFLAAARKNYLAFYMVSDWQKEAGAVYWSSDVCPEKLADEADFVLVYNPLMQGDYFVQRRPERKKLCPELEKKLEFSGQVEARKIYFDRYKPATDKHGEKRGGGR